MFGVFAYLRYETTTYLSKTHGHNENTNTKKNFSAVGDKTVP